MIVKKFPASERQETAGVGEDGCCTAGEEGSMEAPRGTANRAAQLRERA